MHLVRILDEVWKYPFFWLLENFERIYTITKEGFTLSFMHVE